MVSFKIFTDSLSRIRTAHIVVIFLLLLNAFFFTSAPLSITIQLLLAFAVFLHHKDDEHVKDELLQSKEELQNDKDIFDNNVIVSETDANGIITYVNENYISVSGYTHEELIGSTHKLIQHPDTDPAIYKKLFSTLQKKQTFNGIFKNKKKDGQAFWVDSHISPIVRKNKIIAYKEIMFDISDKLRTQESLQSTLQEQMSRFEFVVNSSRDGFWDYNLENMSFYLSSNWKQRLGFNKDQKITYLEYLSLIPDEERFEHHKAMHDALENYPEDIEYVHFRIKYKLITKDGEKLMIEDVGNIFFDTEKNPQRITGFHRDITNQERQQKIIESQNRVAALGDMISNVAHQWRQPISAINNTLNDLELDIELEELQSVNSSLVLSTSKKIKEYTHYMNQTIDDFRQLTSSDKRKEIFTVQEILRKSYEIAETEYKKHHIHYQLINTHDNDTQLNGYARELQQVIINLLNNAKDILIEKKISSPTVLTTLLSGAQHITIIIHDNAGGIPTSIMPKIFDPYFTTKHESLGTGIGLYMSKNIITNYFHGTLEVINENQGAKFIITLPKETDV